MSAESLLLQSFNVTLIGMSVVFVFLVILIVVVLLLGQLVQWAEKRWPAAVPAAVPAAATNNTLLAVAIAAAKRFQGK